MEVLKGELNSTSTYVTAQLTKDQLLVHHINTLTKINVKIDKCELPTFYWLPKLHKRPYKSRFISNSRHCSTTILSKHITSALTAVKDHVMKYSETAFSNSNVNYFWSIKNSSEVIEKLRLRNFQGSQVSSFDFSTLYTSLPHDLINAKVLSLVNWCFNRESKSYLCTSLKALLQVLIYKALYDKSYLGSKTTMTSGEWTCLISFATTPLTYSERGGSEKFKMKIYFSSGIRTHNPPVHDRKVAAP